MTQIGTDFNNNRVKKTKLQGFYLNTILSITVARKHNFASFPHKLKQFSFKEKLFPLELIAVFVASPVNVSDNMRAQVQLLTPGSLQATSY